MTTFAFPSGHNPQRGRQEDGMTLRQYYAGQVFAQVMRDLPLTGMKEWAEIDWNARDGNPFIGIWKTVDLFMQAEDLT